MKNTDDGSVDTSLRVAVWCVVANQATASMLRAHLSDDEQEHANSFGSPEGRREFIVARGFIRLALSGYLGTVPRGIHFSKGEHGKPQLADAMSNNSIRFNVSHSGGVVLATVAAQQVGIDVEHIRPEINFKAIASTVFSPAEQMWLSGVRPAERQVNCFKCWTRKEALMKALGIGMSDRTPTIDIVPDANERTLRISGIPDADRWTLVDLGVEDRFAAAIAIASRNCIIHLSSWPGSLLPSSLAASI